MRAPLQPVSSALLQVTDPHNRHRQRCRCRLFKGRITTP
uniref:Uncharacterized protein n=1 Tax=Anguilla anguilla TaxID=7936 RepID=A0A0E9VT18_ANGAN